MSQQDFAMLPGYDAGTGEVCAETTYAADNTTAAVLAPFASWELNTGAPAHRINFTGPPGLPSGKTLDPDPAHMTSNVLAVWTAPPTDPGAILLYSGPPGTPAEVPVDWDDPAIYFVNPPPVLGLPPGQGWGVVGYTLTRKDETDPNTYYVTNWAVCVPTLDVAPTPPPVVAPVPALAELRFRQSALQHADLFAHAELGAAIDVTWARRYMTARRLWVRGFDLHVVTSSEPVAERWTLDIIASALTADTPSGATGYFRIGHPFNRKIAPG